MNNNTGQLERLAYLFDRYYAREISADEKQELFRLIDIFSDDEELVRLLKRAWERLPTEEVVFENSASDRMLNSILEHGSESSQIVDMPAPKKAGIKKYLIAAAILMFAVTGVRFCHFYHKDQQLAGKKLSKPVLHDALPGGNKALLTLANGKTIILDNAQNGMVAKQGGVEVSKAKNGLLVYNAVNAADRLSTEINTISTPRGGQYQVVLPDGSKVWLNAASSIKFPANFAGSSRNVSITGEAYFEVSKNPAKPFIVSTEKASIEVLGTHFNVMAYSDEADMKTTLLEGKVKVKSSFATNFLAPGEQAVLDGSGKTRIRNDIDVDDETAWKDGIFQFSDAGIKEIMRQAARWYDVTISYEGDIPTKHFSGRISRNVKASELLNMLAYTGVKYRIERNNITIIK